MKDEDDDEEYDDATKVAQQLKESEHPMVCDGRDLRVGCHGRFPTPNLSTISNAARRRIEEAWLALE